MLWQPTRGILQPNQHWMRPRSVPATGWTWNPSDKAAAVSLSNGNLTATGTSSGDASVRGTISQSTGKYYWEVASITRTSNGFAMGIATAGTTLTGWAGAGTTACVAYGQNGGWDYNSGGSQGAFPGFFSGDTLCFAVDFGGQLIWASRDGGTTWYGQTSTGNPASGTNGFSFSLVTGPFYPFTDVGASGETGTIRPNAASWAFTPPSGFGELT